MSRSLHPPTPLDWQALLLEAIERRDAPRAVHLAQRCVHRHGMNVLDALLERADGASGQAGDARSWLLAELKEGRPESQAPALPTHPSPAPSASEPTAEPESRQADEDTVLAADLPWVAADTLADETDTRTDFTDPVDAPLQLVLTGETSFSAPSPLLVAPEAAPAAGPDPLAPVASAVAETSDTSNVPEDAAVAPADPLVLGAEVDADQAKPSLAEPAQGRESGSDHPLAPATAALDLAFAPLEIAFPPLPLSAPERQEAPEPSVSPAPVAEIAPSIQARVAPSEAPGSAHSAASTADGTVAPVEREVPAEPLAVGAAAPVPRFQVDDLPEKQPRPSRRRDPSDERQEAPSKVAKALDGWRAWLPGAFRSRDRS